MLLSLLHNRNRRRFVLSINLIDCYSTKFLHLSVYFYEVPRTRIQYGCRVFRFYYSVLLLYKRVMRGRISISDSFLYLFVVSYSAANIFPH